MDHWRSLPTTSPAPARLGRATPGCTTCTCCALHRAPCTTPPTTTRPTRPDGEQHEQAATHAAVRAAADQAEARAARQDAQGCGWRTLRLRVVAVWHEQDGKYRWYATNAPRSLLHPGHIGALYAARWEVELLFRELKLHYRIEHLPTRRRAVTESLIYAALLTLVLGRRLRQWLAASRPLFRARRSTMPRSSAHPALHPRWWSAGRST